MVGLLNHRDIFVQFFFQCFPRSSLVPYRSGKYRCRPKVVRKQ